MARTPQVCPLANCLGDRNAHLQKLLIVLCHTSDDITAILYGKVWFVLYALRITKQKHLFLQGCFANKLKPSFLCSTIRESVTVLISGLVAEN